MGWALEVAESAVKAHGALQKPSELAGLLALCCRILRPDQAILEIGCDVGGTLWAWSQLPGEHPLIGVTLPDRPATPARQPDFGSASMVFADSHDSQTQRQVAGLLSELELGMLFIDGEHTLASVEADFWLYRSLVSPGGLIALHDIAPHMAGYCEVDRLWNALDGLKLEIVHPPREVLGIGVLLV